jgi:hypothetical protein
MPDKKGGWMKMRRTPPDGGRRAKKANGGFFGPLNQTSWRVSFLVGQETGAIKVPVGPLLLRQPVEKNGQNQSNRCGWPKCGGFISNSFNLNGLHNKHALVSQAQSSSVKAGQTSFLGCWDNKTC